MVRRVSRTYSFCLSASSESAQSQCLLDCELNLKADRDSAGSEYLQSNTLFKSGESPVGSANVQAHATLIRLVAPGRASASAPLNLHDLNAPQAAADRAPRTPPCAHMRNALGVASLILVSVLRSGQ